MRLPEGDRLLRAFMNLWTIIILPFIVLSFFLGEQLQFLAAPAAVLYTGMLALYVGTKEFDRWYKSHKGRHPGEWFVILWTVVIAFLFGASIIMGPEYTIHSDLIAVYIAVVSLYAFTQKSKELRSRKAALDREEASIEARRQSV